MPHLREGRRLYLLTVILQPSGFLMIAVGVIRNRISVIWFRFYKQPTSLARTVAMAASRSIIPLELCSGIALHFVVGIMLRT